MARHPRTIGREFFGGLRRRSPVDRGKKLRLARVSRRRLVGCGEAIGHQREVVSVV
jgi:hypothetical protein